MITRYLRHLTISLAAVASFMSAVAFAEILAPPAGKPQTGLPAITLKVGSHSVHADVANTEATRELGLMYRQKMEKQDGMLFVFPEIGYHAMWMRNTLIPLSVAYMDERGVIVSIHEMQALSEDVHQSAGPARYALDRPRANFSKLRASVTIRNVHRRRRKKLLEWDSARSRQGRVQ